MTASLAHAYVGVGSNYRARESIACGLSALAEQFSDLVFSQAYLSADVKQVTPQCESSRYINLAVRFTTTLDWNDGRQALKRIETACGRRRGTAAGDVVALDLDLLMLAPLSGDDVTHQLPFDELQQCLHVLAPLAELLPDWIHPQCATSLSDLWQAQRDHGTVLSPIDLDLQAWVNGMASDETASL